MAFGTRTTVPQGYINPLIALIPSVNYSNQVSARLSVDINAISDLRATGNLSASNDFDVNLTPFANVLSNVYPSIEVGVNVVSSLVGVGNLAVTIDWAARPSAFDIAQEVLNAQKALYNAAGTIGEAINDAAAGGGGGGGGGTIIREDELAQGGNKLRIILNNASSSTDNLYEGSTVVIMSGTGAGQARRITRYTGSTRTADVLPTFKVAPDNTSVYRIIP